MKAYNKIIIPDKLSPSEFDNIVSNGYFPTQFYFETLTHLVFPNFFENQMDVFKVYPLRFKINEITLHASHKRIIQSNKRFTFKIKEFKKIQANQRKLYKRYLKSINFNRSSEIEDIIGYEKAEDSQFNIKTISVFDGAKLIACGIFYLGETYGTSILHFFDPAYKEYSLGKYMILLTIDYLKQLNYPLYSPGYLVNNFPKFDYKLFVGKEAAYVFHTDTQRWEKYDDSILIPVTYSEEEIEEIVSEINAFF